MAVALFLFLCFSARADISKFALVLGGGGEPPGDNTQFDSSTVTLADRLAQAHYTTDIAFDGDHPATQAMLAKAFQKPMIDEFSSQSAKQKIKDLTGRLGADIPRGAQVVVFINTHGAPAQSENGTHVVATRDLMDPFSTGELGSLQIAAEKNGVKLAIIDLSCYSGAILNLGVNSAQTCLIGASSKHSVASGMFADKFVENVAPGRTMEVAFMDSRNQVYQGYPEINTAAGLAARDALQTIHDNVGMTYARKNGISLDKNGKNVDDTTINPRACTIAGNLERQIPRLMQALVASYGVPPEFLSLLQQATVDYGEALRQALDDDDYMDETVQVVGQPISRHYLLNLAAALAKDRKLVENPNVPERAKIGFQFKLDHAAELATARQDLMKDPRVVRYGTKIQAIANRPAINLAVAQAADTVGFYERQLYDGVYAKQTNEHPSDKDPCRDFQF